MVCLATRAALVSAQAPAPAADGGSGQAVAPQEPAEAPTPQPQPPDAPPPPNATPSPAPTTPDGATDATPPPLPVADSSTSVSAAGSASVSILDGSSQSAFRFSPGSITVGAGDSVTWTNNGSEAHDVTGSGLSSGTLQPGQGYSHTFASPGTFSYICSIHPFMKGSVTVQASGSSGGGGSDSGSTQTPPAATAPGSESAAVTSPGAAGSAAQLPSTGLPVLPLLAAGMGMLLAGALLRRRARVS
jgi:plastocyanin